MSEKPLKIYPSPPLLAWLECYRRQCGPTQAINALYDRYRAILDDNTPCLSIGEWWCCFDAMNGVISTDRADTAQMLPAQVQDFIADEQADQKWDIDGQELVRKLASMTLAEQMAVMDACERFWGAPETRIGKQEEILTLLGVPYG